MKLVKTFCSIYTTIVLLIMYALLCAVATFIEADAAYGIQAAQDLIYRSIFFNVVHFLLLLNLIGVFIYRKIWKTKKYYSIILHISFIVILIGAALTRFYGFEGLMHIRESQASNTILTDSEYLNIRAAHGEQIYYTNIPVRYNAVTQTKFHEKIPFQDAELELKYNSYHSGDMNTPAHINVTASYKGESKTVNLPQSYLDADMGEVLQLGGTYFQLVWGPASITVPFEIYLKDFELLRYPGSKSPSSYKSIIQVRDNIDNSSFDYEIFMNNVLDYKGYRFFQSSYDQDEKGTILSINKDPGKIPTYIGYFLLTLGFLLSFFAKNTRVWTLNKYLKNQKLYVFFIALSSFLLLAVSNLYAYPELSSENSSMESSITDNNLLSDDNHTTHQAVSDEGIKQLISGIAKNMDAHSKKAGRILIQDLQGRIKPLDTLALDMVHKLIRKDSFQNMNYVELFLAMMMYYDEFQHVKMFNIKSEELRNKLGIDKKEKASFSDAYDDQGNYKLKAEVDKVYQKNPKFRSTYDKELMKFDEKMSIAYYIFTAQAFVVFPDITGKTTGFLSPGVAMATFDKENTLKIQDMLKNYFRGVDQGIKTNNWDEADKYLEALSSFQRTHGKQLIPENSRITVEILMNKYNIFKMLTEVYTALGVILFIIVMVALIKNKPVNNIIRNIFVISMLAAAVLHTIALIGRWYVAGHAPWSNAYESMIYIAWAGSISGVLFFRKSLLALAATNFVAGITLLVANLGFMDPQIGTLVPVLKSYWLNIHVSVITASYSFFGLNFVLGFISLILFILRDNKKQHIDQSILNIHCINEISMIFGLGLLTVGTFLGGVWANESWGRYWGWDPKETWSLITVVIYTAILHARFIPKLNKPYVFAVLSTVGFYTILMTYFGVNYYLTGMHSYASGDPVPVPFFVYVMLICHIAMVVLSYRKRKLDMPVMTGKIK